MALFKHNIKTRNIKFKGIADVQNSESRIPIAHYEKLIWGNSFVQAENDVQCIEMNDQYKQNVPTLSSTRSQDSVVEAW